MCPAQLRPVTVILGLASVCLGAAPGLPAQTDTVPPAEVVALRFGWPVGLSAWVDVVRTREEGNDTAVHRLSYRMSAEAHPKGRLIRHGDFTVPGMEAAIAMGGAAALEQMNTLLGTLMPSYVVSAEGEFVGVHDIAPVRAAVDSMIRARAGEMPGAQAEQMLERLLSPEVLQSQVSEFWNAAVGAWIEGDLEIGSVYEMEAQEPTPLFPDILLPTIYQFAVVGRVACDSGAVEERCVELEMQSYPDPEKLVEFLTRFMREAGVAGGDTVPVFEELEMENTVWLVAEPATLIPYELEVAKHVAGTVRVGKETHEFARVDRREYRFQYQR